MSPFSFRGHRCSSRPSAAHVHLSLSQLCVAERVARLAANPRKWIREQVGGDNRPEIPVAPAVPHLLAHAQDELRADRSRETALDAVCPAAAGPCLTSSSIPRLCCPFAQSPGNRGRRQPVGAATLPDHS